MKYYIYIDVIRCFLLVYNQDSIVEQKVFQFGFEFGIEISVEVIEAVV